MRSILLFLLLLITADVFTQQLKFNISKYDVFLDYYEPHDGILYDTLHYDSALLLTDELVIYEHTGVTFYPILKGNFKKGKLIDSLFLFQNDGHLYMRGYFAESNITDTFSFSQYGNYSSFFRFPGVKSGKFTTYNVWTRQKTRIENYANGKLSGEVLDFYDGFLTHKFYYRNGMRNGTCYYYFNKSSIVKREWNYCNDTICGISKEWYSKDTLFRVSEYKNGWEVSTTEYWNNGNLWRRSFRTETGDKDSTETEWYKDGQLWYIKTYKRDLLNGKYEEHYPSGQPKIRSTYLNDSLEGKFESWYPNGKIEEKGYFKRGYAQKGYQHYDENGKKNGQWSNYGNRSSWGYGYPGVIDGVYIKENLAEQTFNYHPTPPDYKINNTYTKKERRLLAKYDSLQIELHLFDSYQERFYNGYAQKVVIKSKIKEKDRVKIEKIIRTHFEIISPFMVGVHPATSVLNGVVKFENYL